MYSPAKAFLDNGENCFLGLFDFNLGYYKHSARRVTAASPASEMLLTGASIPFRAGAIWVLICAVAKRLALCTEWNATAFFDKLLSQICFKDYLNIVNKNNHGWGNTCQDFLLYLIYLLELYCFIILLYTYLDMISWIFKFVISF